MPQFSCTVKRFLFLTIYIQQHFSVKMAPYTKVDRKPEVSSPVPEVSSPEPEMLEPEAAVDRKGGLCSNFDRVFILGC